MNIIEVLAQVREVLPQQDQTTGARALLAPVYNWFTQAILTEVENETVESRGERS